MEDKEILNLKEASKMLNIHTNTARRWIKEGKLKGKRIGRRWLFLRNNILDLLK